MWQILTVTRASTRFDDGHHTSLATILERPEGSQLRAWQTMCDRLRRGTRFVQPYVAITGTSWSKRSFKPWQRLAKKFCLSTDFWHFDHDMEVAAYRSTLTYQAFVKSVRDLSVEAINSFATKEDHFDFLVTCSNTLALRVRTLPLCRQEYQLV